MPLSIALVPLVLQVAAGPNLPRFEKLENGLRVCVVEDHAAPLVSVQLWFGVGSAADAADRPGLIHLARSVLEHRDQAALTLRAAGVEFDSRTLRDACYFSSTAPRTYLDFLLQTESTRLRGRPVTGDELKHALKAARTSARNSVRDDLRGLNAARPAFTLPLRSRGGVFLPDGDYQILLATLLGDDPAARPPGEIARVFSAIEPAECDDVLGRWFVPGNATLFVIGDISIEAATARVRANFEWLPWREAPARRPTARFERRAVRLMREIGGQRVITVAWTAPPLAQLENAALDVLMHRLCNPVDGVIAARWEHLGWRDGGLMVLQVNGRENADVVAALEKLATEPADAIAHDRARRLAALDVRTQSAAFRDRAGHLAELEMIGGDILLSDSELGRIAHVSVDDVRHAARRAAETLREATQIDDTQPPVELLAPLDPLPISVREAVTMLATCTVPLLDMPAPNLDSSVCEGAPELGVTRTAVAPLSALRAEFSDTIRCDRLFELASAKRETGLSDLLSFRGIELNPSPRGMAALFATDELPQVLEIVAAIAADAPWTRPGDGASGHAVQPLNPSDLADYLVGGGGDLSLRSGSASVAVNHNVTIDLCTIHVATSLPPSDVCREWRQVRTVASPESASQPQTRPTWAMLRTLTTLTAIGDSRTAEIRVQLSFPPGATPPGTLFPEMDTLDGIHGLRWRRHNLDTATAVLSARIPTDHVAAELGTLRKPAATQPIAAVDQIMLRRLLATRAVLDLGGLASIANSSWPLRSLDEPVDESQLHELGQGRISSIVAVGDKSLARIIQFCGVESELSK
ncbi:MAG: insulinase family protein [Phycisphaerae bacterium]